MTNHIEGELGVALIGITRENYGLGSYMINFIHHHPNARLVAIGDKLNHIETFMNQAHDYSQKNIQAFDIRNMESLFTLKNVDLVIIASPEATHLEYLKYGITHNKNILIEKPLVPFSQNPNILRTLFNEADKKNILISTNCQRAYIPLFLKCKKPQKSILIKMSIGVKNKVEEAIDLATLLISHPVSILVKLGLDNIDAYKEIGYATKNEGEVCFNFKYDDIDGQIILQQSESIKFATIDMLSDEDIIHVTTITNDGKALTQYNMNGQVFHSDDLLKVSVYKIVNHLLSKKDEEPIINNIASLNMALIQHKFFSSLIGH